MSEQQDRRGDEPSAAALVVVAGVTGAAISTMGNLLGAETLSATDRRIARVDELQFDLGEGPCWDAIALGRPVLEPDLQGAPQGAWPAFADAVRGLRIGAIDLYDEEPRSLDDAVLARTADLTAATARSVLRRAIERAQLDEEPVAPHSRRVIHQATGFVIAQLGVPVDEAELLIRASAFAEGRPMREVAEEIVRRERSFTVHGGSIEERR